jgi:hypothetical protein
MSEISANDLVDLVREAENDIKAALIEICEQFRVATGFCLDDIWIKIVDVTAIGDSHPVRVVDSVDCSVALRN